MAGTFKFELVSPERILMSEDVTQVNAPGMEGDFTVLAGHAPVISTLRPGFLNIELPTGAKQRILVFSGFAEIDGEQMTVLAQQAVAADDIDAAWIAREREAAVAAMVAAKDDNSLRMAMTLIEQIDSLKAA